MSGQHAARHQAQPESRRRSKHPNLLPAIAGVAVAALLIGAAVASLRLGSSGSDRTVDLAASAPADRSSGDRADRGQARTSPSTDPTPAAGLGAGPTPSPTPSKTPGKAASSKPPTSPGGVASSGTCGVSYYETGSRTANGESFDPDGLTAAHKTLPFNTKVRVTNPANGKSVVVRINDRGPFVGGRCIDLSRGAFSVISSLGAGVLNNARYEVLK